LRHTPAEHTCQTRRFRRSTPPGYLGPNIKRALIAAGKDLDRLEADDLAMLEFFHTMGRIATSHLVGLAGITSEDEVLDAGSGVGDTARNVADRCGCAVTAVDLTEKYCETARWLNRLVGLDDQITVRRADVTDMPFTDGTFRVVLSQHVQMNVADTAALYREVQRVLAGWGVLAIWTSPVASAANLTFRGRGPTNPPPVIWSRPRRCAAVESSGSAIDQSNDLTDQASSSLETDGGSALQRG
jgi:sarcosine/dimethylglycine N-methyltransferase